MIIDSHLHVFDRTAPGAEDNFPLWPGNRWGAGEADLLAQMDAAGIERAFLISYTPVDVMAHYRPENRDHMVAVFQHYLSHSHFYEVWSRHRDRFHWFADSIDPRVPGYVERAARDLDRGAAGFKLLPLFVDTEMGDPAWRPIFELLRERQRPCIIDLSWWYAHWPWFAPSVHGRYASYTEYVRGLGELVNSYPQVRVQLAHYGTPRLQDEDESGHHGEIHYDRLEEVVQFVDAHPQISCDLAAYQHLIQAGESYPYQRALEVVRLLHAGLGAARIHWGTDWPYLGEQPYGELIGAIREAPFLGSEEAALILGGNAAAFVG